LPPPRGAAPLSLHDALPIFAGSTVLRAWLDWAFRKTATYGPLSAPVAVLLFPYLTALAILLGAELNAEIDRLWPRPETEQARGRSEEHTSELQSRSEVVCRL